MCVCYVHARTQFASRLRRPIIKRKQSQSHEPCHFTHSSSLSSRTLGKRSPALDKAPSPHTMSHSADASRGRPGQLVLPSLPTLSILKPYSIENGIRNLRYNAGNLVKKPWVFIRVRHMNPTILGFTGPGCLHLPTLAVWGGASQAMTSPKRPSADQRGGILPRA